MKIGIILSTLHVMKTYISLQELLEITLRSDQCRIGNTIPQL
jgi:hypothetical protein